MISLLRKSSRRDDDRGASAVEYALLVAAIAAVIIAIVFGLGGIVKGIFTSTCSSISHSAAVGGTC